MSNGEGETRKQAVVYDDDDDEEDDDDFVPTDEEAEESSASDDEHAEERKGNKKKRKTNKKDGSTDYKKKKLKTFTSTSGIVVEEDDDDLREASLVRRSRVSSDKKEACTPPDEILSLPEAKNEKIDKVWEEMNSNKPMTDVVTMETTVTNIPAEPAKTAIASIASKILQNTLQSTKPQITSQPKKDVNHGGGIKRSFGSSLLTSSAAKQRKPSALELSRQKWNSFKTESEEAKDMTHELGQHIKSNNSFLEKVSFLQRTDLRQFEQEKEVRNKERMTSTSKANKQSY